MEDSENKSIAITDYDLFLLGGGSSHANNAMALLVLIFCGPIFFSVQAMRVQSASETHDEISCTSSRPPLSRHVRRVENI